MEIEFRNAIRDALDEELARDESVIFFGEDVAVAGGVFAATPGPAREVRPGAGVRHADLGAGDDRRRLRRRGHRQAAGAGDHVRRLPRAVDGQPDQPGDEVLVPDRRAAELPAGDPLGRRRRRPVRRDPLADAGLVADRHPRPEDRRALDAGRREGPAQGRDPRRQPGDLLRAQAALLDERPGRRRRAASRSAGARSSARATTSRSSAR